MKKDAYFFPHYCNARHDRKLKRVQKELGVEGYGIFFMLLEVLREQTDFKYPISDIDLLADEFGTSEQKVRTVISNYDLFYVDEDEKFVSPKLIFYLQPYLEKVERAREAARIRWDKSKNPKPKRLEKTTNNAKAMQMHSKSNADAMQGDIGEVGEDRRCKTISPEKSGDDILNPDNPYTVEGFPIDIIRFVTGFQEAAKKELGAMGVKVDAKLIKNGCETIDRLIRLDNFSQADIFSAIRWGYKDEFWSKQIRSLASIRNKQPNGCTKFQNLFAAHKLSFKPVGFTQDANTRLKSNIEAGRRFLENGEPRQEEIFGDYDGTCRRLLIDDNGCGS